MPPVGPYYLLVEQMKAKYISPLSAIYCHEGKERRSRPTPHIGGVQGKSKMEPVTLLLFLPAPLCPV